MEIFKRSLLYFVVFVLCFSFMQVGPVFADEEKNKATEDLIEQTENIPSEENPSGLSNVFTLGEVEVISSQENSGNPTSVRVGNKELREFNANTVPEAAKLVPGLSIDRVGARNETMVRIRGFDQKHVPIYLDGIPIYVPYDGYPDLSRFTTFDLSEMVISKGFTSVLYGPNTMGGAINLVSRKPVKQFEANAGVAGGIDGWHTYGNAGTNQGLWYLQGSASYLSSEGYLLPDYFTPTATEDGAQRNNSYKEDSKFSIKIGLTPNETDEYSLTYINQHGKKGTPPYTGDDPSVSVRYWRWPYWDKQSVYFNSNTSIGSQNDFYVKTRLFYDSFKNALNSYDDDTYTTQVKKYAFCSSYDDHTIGGSLEFGTYIIPYNTLKMAVHYKGDYHNEHNEGSPRQHFHEDIYSIGLEDTIDVTDDLYFIAGISYDYIKTIKAEDLDDNDNIVDFDKKSTDGINPQLGMFYRIGEGGLAHASVAAKTRMPSIKDKFSYKMGKALPNPDLDPERSVNYELGYRQEFNKTGKAEVTAFYYDIHDYIESVDITSDLYQNQNIGHVEEYGVELSASANIIWGLFGGFNYTYLHYNNLSTSDELTNTPNHKAFAYLKYEFFPDIWLMVDGEYNSRRWSDTDRTRKAAEYYLFGAKFNCRLTDYVSFNVGVSNIFDQLYEIDEGYPEEGRNVYAGVDFNF